MRLIECADGDFVQVRSSPRLIERIRRFFPGMALAAVEADPRAVLVISPEETGPMVVVQSRGWDSEFHGRAMGKLDIASPPGCGPAVLLVERAVAEARQSGFEHLMSRVDSSAISVVWSLEGAGMRVVEAGQTLARTPDAGAPEPTPLAVRTMTAADIEPLGRIAEGIFGLSYMYVDPFFSKEVVDRLHRGWIGNLYRGLADLVWVWEEEGQPVGFVSCVVKDRVGDIALVGTHPEQAGKGIGRHLVRAALRWFNDKAERVEVRTQTNNYPALALYQSAGFRVAESSFTLTMTI